MTKHLVNIVLNNFTNDSRVLKEALTQEKMGFKVTVCALHSEGLPFQEKRGEILIDRQDIGRAKMPKGKFFGLLIYIKLIFMIIRKYRKADVWHCNDLEPLVIAWLAKIFNRKLTVIYDAHEYTRERNGRTGLLKWLVAKIEPIVIKCADEVITVSDGIVEEYKRLYNLEQVHLIRNAPHKKAEVKKMDLFRSKFPIPKENTIFLYQGAFTFGRGIDLLVDAFSELKSEPVSLVFLGGGLLTHKVEAAAKEHDNVHYHPGVPYEEIINYSSSADYGLNSVENICLSYYYCLPNKLFEYMQAGIPIITTPLFDCMKVIKEWEVGIIIEDFSIEAFKKAFMHAHKTSPGDFSENLKKAGEYFNWENEEKKLIEIYSPYLNA